MPFAIGHSLIPACSPYLDTSGPPRWPARKPGSAFDFREAAFSLEPSRMASACCRRATGSSPSWASLNRLTTRSVCQPTRSGWAAASSSSTARAVAVARARLLRPLGLDLDLAELVVADPQVALPSGIARIGGGELAGDRQVLAVAFDRFVEALERTSSAPMRLKFTDRWRCHSTLSGVAGDELFEHRDGAAKVRQRLLELLGADQAWATRP